MATSQVRYLNDPARYREVDAVIVDERPPPARVQEVAQNVVACVGRFQWGPLDTLTTISSRQEFTEIFGGYGPDAAGVPYEGYIATLNKVFDAPRYLRVSHSGMAFATRDFSDAGPVVVVQVAGKWKGHRGNSIKASIQAATDAVANHFNVVVSVDDLVVETHKNLDLATIANGAFFPITSAWVTIKRVALGAGRPVNIAATALTGGSDGAPVDADYTGSPSDIRGIRVLHGAEAAPVSLVFVAEKMSSAIKAALLTLSAEERKIVFITTDSPTDTKATAITDVALNRSDRVIYVYPYVKTYAAEAFALNPAGGGLVTTSLTSFAASVVAGVSPHIDPAGVNGESRLYGVRELVDKGLATADFINFNTAGIMALNFAAETGRYRFRSGITSNIVAGFQMIHRRRMTDFLGDSVARALVSLQNKPLTGENKLVAKGIIEAFLVDLQGFGMIPKESDLSKTADGQQIIPFEVDITSLNTSSTEATGLFIIVLRVRIFSSMRFIVLRTEIGEGVEIRFAEAA
jgi:hypothetical protein